MFQIEKNNQKIGEYIRKLISQKYKSERQFCQAYLKLQGLPTDDEETRKMQNRFSQILNGKKAIQTYDLPFVTELLGVSCEEILSAGKCYMPVSSHITNYDVAFSKDPKVWQAYIDRDDKLILNYDEYGKSVLDYAFEFRNYAFLKFLTDKGYIKFHDTADEGLLYFGADTTIKRRDIGHTDILEAKLMCSDKLRMNMLFLAMVNKDFSVLDMFYARETPMLHFAAIYCTKPIEPERYDCSELVEAIAEAPDEVLDYFTTEYSVSRKNAVRRSVFLYQHLGKVIVAMIRNHDMRVIRVMEKAIEHNNKIYSLIKEHYNDAIEYYVKQMEFSKADAERMLCRYNVFYDNCDVVRVFCKGTNKGIVGNVIRADVEVSDIRIVNLLTALNISYDTVRSVAKED